jgi:hypothetical protein
LTFSTANADGGNPADLLFADPFNNYYGIGSNGDPHFEVASVADAFVVADVSFPDVFGIAIPEPTSLMLIVAASMMLPCRRFRK